MKEQQNGKLKTSRLQQALLLTLTAFAVLMIVTAVYSHFFLFVDNLYRDQWYWYPLFFDSGFSELFFIAPNQHRIVLPAFFIWMDVHWLSAGNYLLNYSGFAAFFIFFSLLGKVVISRHHHPEFAFLVLTSLLFWMGNYTFGRPLFSITENFMLMFFLASILAAVSDRWFLAIFLAMCSSFSFSLGVLCWPVLALISWKSDRREAVSYLLLGIVVLLLYLLLPGSDSIQSKLKIEPVKQFIFVLAYLGTPISYATGDMLSTSSAYWVACIAGGLGLLAFLGFLSGYLTKGDEEQSLKPVFIALQAFAVLSAVLTALGRADFDPVSVRFINFSILLWLSFFLIVLDEYFSTISVCLITVFILMLSVSQFHFSESVAQERWNANKAMVSVRSGLLLRSDAKTLVGWPYDTEPVEVVSDFMQFNSAQVPSLISNNNMDVCYISQFKPNRVVKSDFLNSERLGGDVENLYHQLFFKFETKTFPEEQFSVFLDQEFIGYGARQKLPFWKHQNPAASVILSKLPQKKEALTFSSQASQQCVVETRSE